METFEFQNILQSDGFPKCWMSHTFQYSRTINALKKIHRALKQHFWAEVQQDAKVFYLLGLIHSQYPEVELHSLRRQGVLCEEMCTPEVPDHPPLHAVGW